MQTALNLLGIPCYHFFDLFSSVKDCEMWEDALDAKFLDKGKKFERRDWDQLLGHVSAVTDLPSYAFAPELIEAYPEAKVVLCTRDTEEWYASFEKAVIDQGYHPIFDYLAYLDPQWTGRLRWLSKKIMRYYFRSRTQAELRMNARKVYEDHNLLVKRVTSPARILEYNITSGWEPLCKFLNVTVPTRPFPRINESSAMQEKLGIIIKRSLKSGMLRLVPVAFFILTTLLAWTVFKIQ
jgi:hypothetical protein